jgi:hypothetical protein
LKKVKQRATTKREYLAGFLLYDDNDQRSISASSTSFFFPNHPPVMDAGERPQIRDEHAVVLLLGAGEVGESPESLRAEAKTKEEENT